VTPDVTLRAVLADDEALARERLAAMLAVHREIRIVAQAESGAAAVEMIVRERPDILFLDVQMPGLDGFGVLRCTSGAHRPAVVFVTAHDEHAIRAFEVHAVDYLLKPVTAARLAEAVRRVVERTRTTRTRTEPDHTGLDALLAEVPRTPADGARIPVRGEDGVDLIGVASIRWVEADGDHARLHLAGGTRVLRETMSELEERLAPFRFIRVHRSSIVNAAEIRSIESIPRGNYFIVLRDGTRLRSGRRYREAVQALLA
jgi:two-component system LytT family response regulator